MFFFFLKNKKTINIFWLKKVPYLELCNTINIHSGMMTPMCIYLIIPTPKFHLLGYNKNLYFTKIC